MLADSQKKIYKQSKGSVGFLNKLIKGVGAAEENTTKEPGQYEAYPLATAALPNKEDRKKFKSVLKTIKNESFSLSYHNIGIKLLSYSRNH